VNDVPDRDPLEDLEDEEDRRLSSLLRATHAPANPAVWQRVRAELSASARPAPRRGFDAVLAWFTRPVALAAATAALVVSLGASVRLLDSVATTGDDSGTVAYESASLMESLLDDTAATAAEGTGSDGGDAPADSGGES
jgi:hypothetical protein